MTINEFVGIDCYQRDLITKREWSHREKYGRLIEKIGCAEKFKHCLPIDLFKIRQALNNGDEHLNTINIRLWDSRADTDVKNILFDNGITCTSLSERVCTLKEAAKELCGY